MTLQMSTPMRFEPGAELSHIEAMNFANTGVEPGYPLYALHEFDPMWTISTLSGPHVFGHFSGPPKLVVTCLRASERGEGDRTCRLPLRIREMRFHWTDALYSTFLEGDLEKEGKDATLMQEGKKVYGHRVRVLLHGDLGAASVPGYVQIVPIGSRDQPHPPTCEGFRWASALPVIS